MITWIKKRPWLLIVAAFVVLIISWAFLLKIAISTQPESVPLKTRFSENADH